MDIDDDAVLRGVDAKTYLSLNGPRTTNMISRLIPSSAQVGGGVMRGWVDWLVGRLFVYWVGSNHLS